MNYQAGQTVFVLGVLGVDMYGVRIESQCTESEKQRLCRPRLVGVVRSNGRRCHFVKSHTRLGLEENQPPIFDNQQLASRLFWNLCELAVYLHPYAGLLASFDFDIDNLLRQLKVLKR